MHYLQSEAEVVNQTIEALVALFKLAARRNLSKLQDSLVLTQLSQTHVDIIAESYVEVCTRFSSMTNEVHTRRTVGKIAKVGGQSYFPEFFVSLGFSVSGETT